MRKHGNLEYRLYLWGERASRDLGVGHASTSISYAIMQCPPNLKRSSSIKNLFFSNPSETKSRRGSIPNIDYTDRETRETQQFIDSLDNQRLFKLRKFACARYRDYPNYTNSQIETAMKISCATRKRHKSELLRLFETFLTNRHYSIRRAS